MKKIPNFCEIPMSLRSTFFWRTSKKVSTWLAMESSSLIFRGRSSRHSQKERSSKIILIGLHRLRYQRSANYAFWYRYALSFDYDCDGRRPEWTGKTAVLPLSTSTKKPKVDNNCTINAFSGIALWMGETPKKSSASLDINFNPIPARQRIAKINMNGSTRTKTIAPRRSTSARKKGGSFPSFVPHGHGHVLDSFCFLHNWRGCQWPWSWVLWFWF